MSATNHTTNYELPIFVGSDKPAWLVDWNGAMTAIDTAIHTAEGKADQAGTDIGGIESSISTINSTLTSINNAVSQLRLDTNANTGSINTIQELIGNGTPTTTDKTIIGAINELHADFEDINVYSSTEKVIGKWVDNKPLYQITLSGTTSGVTDAESTVIAGSVDANAVIRDIKGYVNYDATTVSGTAPVGYDRGTTNKVDVASATDSSVTNEIRLYIAGAHFNAQPFAVTVTYTKSTD